MRDAHGGMAGFTPQLWVTENEKTLKFRVIFLEIFFSESSNILQEIRQIRHGIRDPKV